MSQSQSQTQSHQRSLPARNDHLESFKSILSENQSLKQPIATTSTPRLSPQQIQNDRNRRKGEVEWINEAYRVHQHILSLLQFLTSIRKPYLNITSRPNNNTNSISTDEKGKGNELDLNLSTKFNQVKHLNDKQRDEIDFQGRMIVKRCLDRVEELEKAEEVRLRTSTTSSLSPISYLLSSFSSTPQSHHLYSSQLASHRKAITRFLSQMLATCTSKIRDLQERRLLVERERRRNLGREVITSKDKDNSVESEKSSSLSGKVLKGSINGLNSSTTSTSTSFDPSLSLEISKPKESSQLSALQIQQFESESSELVKSLAKELESINAAEKKLSEISEMQTQLIGQLNQQNEITARLYDEAIENTSEVYKGNEQLKEAKKRNREANRMLSVFLVGSGLGLLFLHWMD